MLYSTQNNTSTVKRRTKDEEKSHPDWSLSQTPISLSDTDLQRGKRFWFWILVFLCKKGEREPSGKDMYFQLKLTHYNTTVTFNTQKYYTQELR